MREIADGKNAGRMSKNIMVKAQINPPVFLGSAVLILAFVIFGAVFSETTASVFAQTQIWIMDTFG